ncbi:deoxynucleoside kinase isoform X2 [Diachasma alloeum]|nr:deoxynucleoside kinase isoform X2 [Diachasma alloeum]XP_015118038.1 deoxynucleoside kinase isoform X2 [Diachasma alloeum]XP_015118039.1 deoxynucleoside kinase isoform X2 [Diachasma alloeum]
MASPCKNSRRPFTVCIEGNIGSGKTTFLNNFKQFNNTMVLQEPVELWRNVKGMNLLDLMYKDPTKYACLFQSYVQLTMLQLHTMKSPLPYKVMERSVYSARCFIESMKRMNVLEDVEVTVLEEWHKWSITHAVIETDLIVYLRTTPDIVYKRMRARARKEEKLVSLEYLEQIHQIHEEWLYHKTLFNVPAPIIILDADQSMEEMFVQFEKCKTRIFESCGQSERESRRLTSPVSSPKFGAASD